MPPTTAATFARWELGRLVKTWADNGRPLPVAVVVSIFDDLCESLALAPPGDDVAPSLDHVIIDQAGVARLTVRPRHPVRTVSGLLRDVLAGTGGEDAIPAAAWPILGQGLADDPWIRPPSTDVMQMLLREALGPPAAREEVLDSCSVVPRPRDSLPPPPMMPEPVAREPEVEVLLDSVLPMLPPIEPETEVISPSMLSPLTPMPLPAMSPGMLPSMPEPAPIIRSNPAPLARSATPSVPSMRLEVPSMRLEVPSMIESAPPRTQPAPLPEDLASTPPLLPHLRQERSERSVVRHDPPRRRPVSLPAAPAARLGSTSSPPMMEESGIRLPTDQRTGGQLVLAGLVLATLFLLAWLLGLV